MSNVHVLTGPPRSGKTERLLGRYRAFLAGGAPGSVLWLAPTWRVVAEMRQRLMQGPTSACFSPGMMTFERFAESLVNRADAPIRPLTQQMKRQLVLEIVEELHDAKRLRHFGPIAHRRGLIDLFAEFISELKRLEIWPRHLEEACEAIGLCDKDKELLAVYAAYQERLLNNGLYDAEGRFWSARDWLEKHFHPAAETPGDAATTVPPWPGGLKFVAVDGFTDFTRTQHEILEILSRGVEELWITLPLEPPPVRELLFAKPLDTLKQLRRRHAGLAEESLPRPPSPRWPGMAHLERRLFCNPREAEAAGDTAGLLIMTGARPLGEMNAVAARIKRLILDGEAKPEQIAVVFRTPQSPDTLIGEALTAHGIPASFECGPTLMRSGALRSLCRLLDLALNDWSAVAVRAAIRRSYFRPEWPEWNNGAAAAAVERALGRLPFVDGRAAILDALARMLASQQRRLSAAEGENGLAASDPEMPSRSLSELLQQRDDTAAALALLQRLALALDALPAEATPAEWALAWRRLAAETGLSRAMDRPQAMAEPLAIDEGHAWEKLLGEFENGGLLDDWMGRPSREIVLSRARQALEDLLQSVRVSPTGDEAGCVRVLSAASLRALRVPHLFVAGLSEKAFPINERDDRLYSEGETAELIARGLPLPSRGDRSCDEMLLFYETITRAGERLYLSYASLDDAAEPLSPSPYLREVEAACGDNRIARDVQTDLRPLPAEPEPLSPGAWRVLGVAKALGLRDEHCDDAMLARLVRADAAGHAAPAGLGSSLLAALRIIDQRADRRQFGPAEGMILSAAAQRAVAGLIAPERTFTATELEFYAKCPYRFFVEKVLRLASLEEAGLEADYAYRGRLIHATLAGLHRAVNERLGRPGGSADVPEADFVGLLDAAFAAACAEEETPCDAPALYRAEQRITRRHLDDYRNQWVKYDEYCRKRGCELKPELFEVGFGQGRSKSPDSTPEPFVFVHDNDAVRLSGRIDRVDTGMAGHSALLSVIDYKLTARTAFSDEDMQRGVSLQLPVYAIAACELLLADRDPVPFEAGYWIVGNRGYAQRSSIVMWRIDDGKLVLDDDWDTRRMKLAEVVIALVRGMRRGEFPVYNADETCTGSCPLSTACRINPLRSLEKTWKPSLTPTNASR